MTDPGRRILTRVGLRIPGWIASESNGADSTGAPRGRPDNRSEGDEYREGQSHAQGFDRLADIATTAERSGFDSVWVSDDAGTGLGPPGRSAGFEAYTVLGALATRTRTVNLGAMVSPITARNPAVLAKIVTGVDVLSGGRAILGVGPGVFGGTITRKDSATGQEHASPRPRSDGPGDTQGQNRVSRMDGLAEGLHICRAMFTEEAPSFEGDYYRIEDAHNRPRPVRAGGIPILVGGDPDSGEDGEVLELVARYADAVTVMGGVETVRDRLSTLDRLCDDVGRDPAAISRISVGRLVIAATEQQAGERVDRSAGHEEWDLDHSVAAVVGSPPSVVDQVGELLAVGIDGVVFTMADARDLELVEMAGTTLRSLFA